MNFKLTNSYDDTTASAVIYPKGNEGNPVKTWTTFVPLSSQTLLWDGKNNLNQYVTPGEYIFKVMVVGQYGPALPEQKSFTVVDSSVDPTQVQSLHLFPLQTAVVVPMFSPHFAQLFYDAHNAGLTVPGAN